MKPILLIVVLLLCGTGCAKSKRSTPPPLPQARAAMSSMLEDIETASMEMLDGEGPAGVIQSDMGFTWVIPGNGKWEMIGVKDHLHNEVIRFWHDREVYGSSLLIVPGYVDTVNHPEVPTTLNEAAYFHIRYSGTNHP